MTVAGVLRAIPLVSSAGSTGERIKTAGSVKIIGGDNMEEKKINKLYKLLERAEREHDTEAAAALRWAIFQLEIR